MMRKKYTSGLLIIMLVCFLLLTCFACNDRNDISQESPIQKFIITTMPKTNYYVGDKFSVGDADITVYYENGKSERIPLTLNMISGFDSNVVGDQILTVFYKNQTAYLTVKVSVAPVYSVQVVKMPDKTNYVIGEQLNISGMQILVTYSNNYTEIMDVTEDMVTLFSTDKEGETNMIVSYGGKTCMAAYTVVTKAPDRIEISLEESFRLVYVVGDVFELTGGRFFVHYNDNTSEFIDWETLYEQGDLTYVIEKETNNVFTTSALERNVFLFYKGNRYQVGVTINAKRPQSLSVMSDAPDQILKGHIDLTGGQLYVVYNSKQTGYNARVKDATAEARRANASGNWNSVRSAYFVLQNGNFVGAASEFDNNATYYASLENDFVDRYQTRKEFLYVKKDSSYQKAPAEYDASVVYYIPSNVRLFDFDDQTNVEIVWNEFDINVVGEYSIRLIVDGASLDYRIKVIAPSPVALEVYPGESDVNLDPITGAYFVYQDETIHITDWDYKIKQNNGTYSIISSTGNYSAKVTSDMYVGETFMTNHAVGTYDYDFSFTTVTGVTLSCSVPVEVRPRVIVSATVERPTRVVYSVGDEISLVGGSMRVRYINGAESQTMSFTADMLYAEDPTGNSPIRYVAPDGTSIPLVKSGTDAFTSNVGINKFYIYYEDLYYNTSYATEFDITVIVKAIAIALNEDKETKNDYILGEPFSMENWEVVITYADQSYATENDFSDSRWTIEGDDLSTIGTHTITLYYGDKSDNVALTYVCTVHNNIVSVRPSVDFIGCTTEGKKFDFSGLSFVVVRENGAEENVAMAAMTISQNKAGSFVSVPTSYELASFVTAENWSVYYTSLYVKEGDNYNPATSYDASEDYYYAADNMTEISFTYNEASAIVSSLVVSRRVESVTVAALPETEYILASVGEWDLGTLSLLITFDNGTTAVVKHADSGSTVTFSQSGDRYCFALNNMTYYFEVKANGVNYSLSDFKSDLQLQTSEEFIEKDLVFSVADVVYRDAVSSDAVPFYCFKQRVVSIHAEIGVPVLSGSDIVGVNEFSDTTVYLNEGLSLYTVSSNGSCSFVGDNGNKRFVYNDSSIKIDYLECIYLVVEYDTTTVYKKLSDVASSSGFSVSGFKENKTGSQTIRLTYLLKECSFMAYVRPDVPYAISFVDENEQNVTETTVIEKMDIDPNKISVLVELKDADGDAVTARRKVDFSDAVCTYDKNESFVFNDKNADDVFYTQKTVTVTYEGCSKTLTLTILKKSVFEIVIQNMPRQVYAELPEFASADESVLSYTDNNGQMGTVLVRYNNGTSEIVPLNDSRLRINASQFNTKLILNAGAEQSQIITVGFTDENNVTKETNYNVIVRDRKYLTITYDESNNLSFDDVYYCQYGTGAEARPKFDVYYYSNFYMPAPVAFNGYTVTYEYHDDVLGDVTRNVWPTEVGRYTMVISYAGDYANNAFEDRSVTIEITKKQIGISVEDITLTFGDKFTGTAEEVSSLRVLGFVWNMSGVSGDLLTGEAFVLGDTLENVVSVSFELQSNGRKIEPAFSNDFSYTVMNLNVGSYYVKPIITLKKANYTVPEGIGDLGATLTVSQKAIKIVALGEKKVYGDRDPLYRFEIYDENDQLLGGNYYREFTDFTIGDIVAENVYTYDDTTGIYSRATGTYESGKTYYVFKAEINIDPIFIDTASSSYRLVRSGTDTDNVNDYHKIFSGDTQGTLDNYTLLSYTHASLVVLPAALTLTALKATRPFGTADMSISYVAAASSSFKYSDDFNSVFGSYFEQNDVLYYDITEKKVYETLKEGLLSYDDWAVLYRNVEIDGFESVVYMGATYAVVPIALACGTYTCRMCDVYSNVVANYIVTTQPFEIEILPVSVRLNVGSVLLYEKSSVKDGRRNTFIDYFSFPREDFQTVNIYGDTLTFSDFVFPVENRNDIENLYAEWMSKLIVDVEYTTGTNAPYLLSSDFLNGFTFIKERGTDTGVYRVSVGYNYSDNFSDFSVISRNKDKNKNYFTFYYDIFRNQYAQVAAMQASVYDEDAYVIVMPGFADLKYYKVDEEGARYREVYNLNKASEWGLTAEYSVDQENYYGMTSIGTDSISYSIAPKEGTQFIVNNRENCLAAGDYTGTIRYSYFADANKGSKFSTNYIYLGNMSVLLDSDISTILNYVLFGTIADGMLIFNNTFDYTVTQKPVSVYIENEDAQYNFSNQTLIARVDGSLAAGDRLNFLFDVSVVYNSKTDIVNKNASTIKSFKYYSIVPEELLTRENMASYYEYGSMGFVLTQDVIPMNRKSYYMLTEASDPSVESYDIAYSGTYTIKLNDLGNANYCLITEETVQKTFTVVPNEIPILLYNKAAMPQVNTTDFTFEETYAKKAYAPIDYSWTSTTYANSLLFDNISLTLLSTVNSSATKKIGTVKIGSQNYDVNIKFHGTFPSLSVSGRTISTTGGNSRTLSQDTYSSEYDYYFYFIEDGNERKIFYDSETGTYYYKDTPYTTFRTTTCTITDYYYDDNGVLHRPQPLVNTPNTLFIYSEDAPGSGNRPIYVKRDPVTKKVLGYDIVSRDTSDYVNYTVVFVYLDNGVYRECDDAHSFSFVINPAEVSLYNFSSANSKDYDGAEASIANTSKLTVNGALSTDPISVSDIQFDFERIDAEGSTYITIDGVKYYLVEDDDLRSVGLFKVKAFYSDNYEIVFKGSGAYGGSPSSYGLFTIKRVKATFEFNSEVAAYLSKDYDGLGLADESLVYSGDLTEFLDRGYNIISKQSKAIVDNYSQIHYQLQVKGYASSFGGTPTTIAQDQIAGYDYSAGNYWFDFYGVFVDKDGVYRRYEDRNNKEDGENRWLNWNYTYIVNNKKDVNKIGDVYYDGIYQIDKRKVYIGIDGQLPESATAASYTYKKEYNGALLTRADVNAWLDSGVVTVYIYDAEIKKFLPIEDTYFADSFVGGSVTVAGGRESVSNVSASEYFELSASDISSQNSNFIVVNSDIRFTLKAIEIEIMLTYTNTEDDNSASITYGKTVRENAVNFTLSISEEELNKFNEAIRDGNAYTATQILEKICNFNNAEFYLFGDGNSTNAVFRFTLEGKSQSIYLYNKTGDYYYEASDGMYEDGTTYYSRLLVPNNVALDYTKYYAYHEWYEHTSDPVSVVGKKYYLMEPVTESDPSFRDGNGVPENKYFEQFFKYSLTTDAVFRAGISYYKQNPGTKTYSLVNTSTLIGSSVPADTYYSKKEYYALTSDRVFNMQKRYYTAKEYVFTQQSSTTTANIYYQFNRFYGENDDDYFMSGKDYYVFTVVPAEESKVGTNVQSETYYESIGGRYVLTSDQTFVRSKLYGGQYYTVSTADVIRGDNAHKKYYTYSNGRHNRVPDGTTRQPGVSYYVFVPTVYSATETISERYYYYSDGKFYNVYDMRQEMDGDKNYYVAYVADKSANENVAYYTEYEAIVKAEGVPESGGYYYKAVLMDPIEENDTYYAIRRLLPGKDYSFNENVPLNSVYENVDDSDTYYLTGDVKYSANKNYYKLSVVSGELVAGDKVGDYYIVSQGYSRAGSSFENTDETYYKIVEAVAGKDYAVSSLIPDFTYYTKVEGEDRYNYAQSRVFASNEKYYLFEAVHGVSEENALDSLYVYNDGSYKKIVPLTSGKEYVNGALIGADEVYYRSNDRYVRETSQKYRKDVGYYRFVTAEGYIANASLNDYYVDSSSRYTIREMTAGVEYSVGQSISGNVVVADSFTKTNDTQYLAGKLYYTYDNEGYVSGALVGSYSVPAEGYYSIKKKTDFTVGQIAGENVYVLSGDRYKSVSGSAYRAGITYYTFIAMSGYIAKSDLDGYYVSGRGYYSAVMMTKGVDYEVNTPVMEGVYRLIGSRMIAVPTTDNYADDAVYYFLDDSGVVPYSGLNGYYVDGSKYYSKKSLTLGVDYSIGDSIAEGVYVRRLGRYVLPEELTFRSGMDYYSMDNTGLVLASTVGSYCISGEKYYSFTLLAPEENDHIEGDVFEKESSMFIPTSDTVYRSDKEYYLRSNEGIIDPSDIATYFVDATGYYTLVEQEEGVAYTVGASVPNNMYYEITANGICRFTRDETFIPGKKYYLFRAENTYLPADTDITPFYFENSSEYAVCALIAGKDYVLGSAVDDKVYVVDDKWYTCLTSGVYEANKRYFILEAAAGYICAGDVSATYLRSGSNRFMAVRVRDYTIGDVIPNDYYTLAADNRLIPVSGNFIEGIEYYVKSTNGFVYGANESELYIADGTYYSFIVKDVSSLYGTSAVGSYVRNEDGRMVAVTNGNYTQGITYYDSINSGLVQIARLGDYYVSGTGCYSVEETSFSTDSYVYLKDGEYVKTTDASAQNGTSYYRFFTGGFVINKYYSQYFVPTKAFRTDKVVYDHYRYGNDVPYAVENKNDDFYSQTVPGRVYEKSGETFFTTSDSVFVVGKEYYLFVPVTDFSERETADGLYVFRKGYIRSQLPYAALRKAEPGIDYQVGGFVSGRFFTLNANSVPFEVPNGNMFSADTVYYCLNNYYGITSIPTYYELNEDGSYSVTTDRTFNNAKNYYAFTKEDIGVGNNIPQGYYFVKNGNDFVEAAEEVFLPDVDYYTVRSVSVTNGAYVVKGTYEKVGDIYILTGDTVMDANKTYYRFTKDNTVNNSDPVLLYEKVGDEYVLTNDSRANTSKEYYFFKQSSATIKSSEYAVLDSSYVENGAVIPAGVYMLVNNEYVSVEGGTFDTSNTYYTRSVRALSYFTGAGKPYFSGTADLSSLSAGIYYTGANNFTSSANYSLKIVSTPFEVRKQIIHITGVEREYYDAEKSNWNFILGDDTEVNSEVLSILYSDKIGLRRLLHDESDISSNAGSYYTATSGNYFMTMSKTEISKYNESSENNYYIVCDGVSVSGVSSDLVCIPLFIKRVPVVVSIELSTEIEYGDRPAKSVLVSGIRYSRYPNVSSNQAAAQKQREFFSFIEGDDVIDFDSIIRTISTTDYNNGNSTSLSLLYNLAMDIDLVNNSGYDNYFVSFGEIVYTIVQKRVNIQVVVNNSYYDGSASVNNVSFPTRPFTVLYSDVNNMFYDDTSNDYRSYSLKIDTFTAGENEYSENNLSEQIMEIITGVEFIRYVVFDANSGNSIVATGTTVQELCTALGYAYTDGMTITELMSTVKTNNANYRLREVVRYKNVTYDSVQMLLKDKTRYIIEDQDGNADYMAGVNNIRLYDETKWYDSNNYILVSAKTPIIVYPEIDSVGEYTDGKTDGAKYINMIGDTEAILSGSVSVNKTTKEISNLSFIVRLNMNGMKTTTQDFSSQYFDTLTFSTAYESSYYLGNLYSREWHLYYVSGGTEGSDGTITLKVGDVVTVTAIVRERFDKFARRPDIESLKFKIRIVEKQIVNSDDTVVSALPLADTTDTVLYNAGESEYKRLSYGVSVKNTSGEYVLYNPSQDGTYGVDVRKENYDMLSMRVRLTPEMGKENYSFSTVIYENAVGKLMFIAVGGTERKCMIRYYYKEDYYTVNTHTVAQPGVTYYALQSTIGGNVPAAEIGNYYTVRGGLLYHVSAIDPSEVYYKVAAQSLTAGAAIANPSAYCVKFSEETLSNSNLGDLFDGNSHKITIYLDKIGYLSDMEESHQETAINVSSRFVPNGSDAYVSGRLYCTATLANVAVGDKVIGGEVNYYMLKDGVLIKPDSVLAKNGVDYYTITHDDQISSINQPTSAHYYEQAFSSTYAFTNYISTYTALRKYYVYVSLDGDVAYASSSDDVSKMILSFTGGLYEYETSYSADKDDRQTKWDVVSKPLNDCVFYIASDGTQLEGQSGISYENVQPIVTYFAMKQKLAWAFSARAGEETLAYMRNVIVFPEQFYDNSSAYLVTKETANSIGDMIRKVTNSILYYSSFGSTDNTNSMSNPSLVASTMVSFGSASLIPYNAVLSESGTTPSVTINNADYGLYRMKLPIRLSYPGSQDPYQYILEYKLLVTDAAISKNTTFYEYGVSGTKMEKVDPKAYTPSASAPVTFSAINTTERYFFNDTPIDVYNSATYTFDLGFADGVSYANAMIYIGLSDRELSDLTSNMLVSNYDLWNASGIGISISKRTASLTTKVYGSVYIPSDYIQVSYGSLFEEDESYYQRVEGNNGSYSYVKLTDYNVGDPVPENCYVIDKDKKANSSNIYASNDYTDIDWERGRNILKVDYIKAGDDALISVRLYQYYLKGNTYVTDFVWQEYFRADFYNGITENASKIGIGSVRQIINNVRYVGFRVSSSAIKLYGHTMTTNNMTDFDLSKTSFGEGGFKYVISGNDNEQTNITDAAYTEGVFVDGHSLVQSEMPVDEWLSFFNVGGEYFALADAYGTPHAYTGNTVSLTFSISPDTSSKNFMWYFGSSTPYLGLYDSESYLRQRGLAIVSIQDDLYFEFYKYGKEYARQLLNLPLQEGFNVADGKEHTITVSIGDFCAEYDDKYEEMLTQTQKPASPIEDRFTAISLARDFSASEGMQARGFYFVKICIDGKQTVCVCPYLNDLSKVLDIEGHKNDDTEIGSTIVDQYFFQGIYYTGIRSEAKMTIRDYSTYDVRKTNE